MLIGYQPKGEKSQMRTSRKLTHYLMAVFAVAMMSMAALAADPGNSLPRTSEASDQKAGSLLVYTHYQSSDINVAARDTKINITNTNDSNPIIVHFFFVSGCSVADFKTELTANQTYSFLTSDVDPGSAGYIIAIAENYLGVPIHFNYLIGDLYTKNTGTSTAAYQANLGAIAFAAEWDQFASNPRTIEVDSGNRLLGTQIPAWTNSTTQTTDTTVTARFSGSTNSGGTAVTGANIGYNRLPSVLALSNIPSRANLDRTLLTVITPTGSLLTGMGSVGTTFGLLFDDAEQSQSFQMSFACNDTDHLQPLSNTRPRTVPRFESVIPAGRTGWMKLWASSTLGILGSMIVHNQQARSGFEGGHNLHHLTLSVAGATSSGTATYNSVTVPVFPFTGN